MFDFIIAQSFFIVNFWNFLWIKSDVTKLLSKGLVLYSTLQAPPYQMLIDKLPCIRFIILTIFKDRCLFYIFCLVLCFIKKPDFAGVNFFLETDRFWLRIELLSQVICVTIHWKFHNFRLSKSCFHYIEYISLYKSYDYYH